MGMGTKLGTKKRAKDIGKKCGYGLAWYIWAACVQCGTERWIRFLKNSTSQKRCHKCNNGLLQLGNNGSRSPGWRGGRRKTKRGYIRVWMDPEDPMYCMSDNDGYVLEHRLVMARKIGRPLLTGEVVHHSNRNKEDNSVDNLVLTSRSEHETITLLEERMIKLLKENVELKKEICRLLREGIIQKTE